VCLQAGRLHVNSEGTYCCAKFEMDLGQATWKPLYLCTTSNQILEVGNSLGMRLYHSCFFIATTQSHQASVCVPSLLLTIHCSTIPLVMIINFVFWALGRSEDSDGRVTWTLVSSQLWDGPLHRENCYTRRTAWMLYQTKYWSSCASFKKYIIYITKIKIIII